VISGVVEANGPQVQSWIYWL